MSGKVTFKRRRDEDGSPAGAWYGQPEYDVYEDGEKVDGYVRKGTAPSGYYNSWQVCYRGTRGTDSRARAAQELIAAVRANPRNRG